MTTGSLTTFGANAILDGTGMPATLWAKWHTGNPGAAGTADPAADTRRVSFARTAATAGFDTVTSATALTIDQFLAEAWTTGETLTHLTLWDDATAGNPWWVVPLATPHSVSTGESVSVSAINLTLAVWPGLLSDVILGLGPVGYWPLNETAGTQAVDLSGNGHHGTYSGTHTLANWAGGDGDNYADFRGGLVTIPDAAAFSANFASGLTWGIFLRPEATQLGVNGARIFMSKGAASNYEWVSGYSDGAAGRLRCNFFNAAGSTITGEQIDGMFTASNWHLHLVASASPVFAQRFDVYLNSDTPRATSATGGLNNAYAAGNASVYLGGRADLAAGNRMVGGLAHAFVIPGRISQANAALIRQAAQAEGWSV
jgi:hypothetical protein